MMVRKVLIRVAAAGLFAAVATVVPATAAQAAPTGCSTWSLGSSGYASCTGGTGTVRVVIECVSVWGDSITRSGQPVGVGQTSKASCPSATWSLQPDP